MILIHILLHRPVSNLDRLSKKKKRGILISGQTLIAKGTKTQFRRNSPNLRGYFSYKLFYTSHRYLYNKMGVDWTKLPPELLESISETLTIYSDYLRFRAVCHSWRASIPKIPSHLPPQLPWLMLPPSQSHQSHCAFYDLSTNRLRFLSLPESSNPNKRHCGSSHGWLIILDESPSILLLNPLSPAKLHLPPLSAFPKVHSFNYSDVGKEYSLRSPSGDRYTRNLLQMRDSFIKKIVLSANPSKEPHFVAIAIVNQTVTNLGALLKAVWGIAYISQMITLKAIMMVLLGNMILVFTSYGMGALSHCRVILEVLSLDCVGLHHFGLHLVHANMTA